MSPSSGETVTVAEHGAALDVDSRLARILEHLQALEDEALELERRAERVHILRNRVEGEVLDLREMLEIARAALAGEPASDPADEPPILEEGVYVRVAARGDGSVGA